METGKIVAFFEQKKILCAFCLEGKGGRLHLLTEENREITLGPNRIVLSSPQPLNPSLPRQTLLEKMKAAVENQERLRRSISVRDLWELVWEERKDFRLRELAEFIFQPPVTFDQEMALLRALFEDRLYFKQKGELYEAREPEKVEEIALQMEREAKQARELEEGSRWLARVWAGESVDPPPGREEIVRLLKEYALLGADAPDQGRAKAFLQAAQISSPQAPFELLVRLGVWAEDENLFLQRHQISQAFPPKVLSEAERIVAQSARGIRPEAQDMDLTFLHPLTIDSEFTRDIDDALSVERVGKDIQVGVHITDVATYLNGYREIFQEAMARATSIEPFVPFSPGESTISAPNSEGTMPVP